MYPYSPESIFCCTSYLYVYGAALTRDTFRQGRPSGIEKHFFEAQFPCHISPRERVQIQNGNLFAGEESHGAAGSLLLHGNTGCT
jgi:hypothetical protein